MTSLQDRAIELCKGDNSAERRAHRRADFERHGINVQRWEGVHRDGETFGQIVDISASGVRIRTNNLSIQPDHQIRVKLELPEYAGISPFIDNSGDQMRAKRDWVGWMTVSRVKKVGRSEMDVAGRLVDMDEIDRGMLGLYLSTQPMAA